MKYLKFSDVFPCTKGSKPLNKKQLKALCKKVNKAIIKENGG